MYIYMNFLKLGVKNHKSKITDKTFQYNIDKIKINVYISM